MAANQTRTRLAPVISIPNRPERNSEHTTKAASPVFEPRYQHGCRYHRENHDHPILEGCSASQSPTPLPDFCRMRWII
jgi:hypothetical protein